MCLIGQNLGFDYFNFAILKIWLMFSKKREAKLVKFTLCRGEKSSQKSSPLFVENMTKFFIKKQKNQNTSADTLRAPPLASLKVFGK
jgi:hypothetical protein